MDKQTEKAERDWRRGRELLALLSTRSGRDLMLYALHAAAAHAEAQRVRADG